MPASIPRLPKGHRKAVPRADEKTPGQMLMVQLQKHLGRVTGEGHSHQDMLKNYKPSSALVL
jgi:hypothetical protein